MCLRRGLTDLPMGCGDDFYGEDGRLSRRAIHFDKSWRVGIAWCSPVTEPSSIVSLLSAGAMASPIYSGPEPDC